MPEEDVGHIPVGTGTHDPVSTASNPQPPDPPRVGRWMWVGALVLLSLAVIFVLPEVVSRYELPFERRPEPAATDTQPRVNPSQPAVSPFAEAQLARERKAAQDVLAELLEAQAELEAFEVERWAATAEALNNEEAESDSAGSDVADAADAAEVAPADVADVADATDATPVTADAYTAALEQAAAGDDHYRAQAYPQAAAAYSDSHQAMRQLLAIVPEVWSRLMSEGSLALEEGDSTTAIDRFETARLLNPDEASAGEGLARAQVLDEVLALLVQAEDQTLDDDLNEAKETLNAAAALDPAHPTVQARLKEVDRLLDDAEFARIMSGGYTLLEQGEFDAATETFRRAAAVGKSDEQAAQVEAAVLQSENARDSARINGLRARIQAAENAERWQDAVVAYNQVLSIDPNLSFAVTGLEKATWRARLDGALEANIANPARLADDEVYLQAFDDYSEAQGLPARGPRLQAQLERLYTLLNHSQQPLNVTLVSDGLTSVEVRPVDEGGRLGTFGRTDLLLKPGDYVAIGSRRGYRDVRVEFTVGFGRTPEQVTVECTERVPGR